MNEETQNVEKKETFEASQVEKVKQNVEKKDKIPAGPVEKFVTITWVPLLVAIYLIIGYASGDKASVWFKTLFIFVQIPVIPSLFKAIRCKNMYMFLYPVFIIGIYLLLGACLGLWHPWWILLITIPGYYYAAFSLQK